MSLCKKNNYHLSFHTLSLYCNLIIVKHCCPEIQAVVAHDSKCNWKFSLGDLLILGISINIILLCCILKYHVPLLIYELCVFCFILNLIFFALWYMDRGDELFRKEILEKSKRSDKF